MPSISSYTIPLTNDISVTNLPVSAPKPIANLYLTLHLCTTNMLLLPMPNEA